MSEDIATEPRTIKRGVDADFLIYAQVPSFEQHVQVRKFIVEQLKAENITLVLTANILHEFIHALTNGRRFSPPFSMAEAIDAARAYLNKSNIECISVDDDIMKRSLELLEKYQLGRQQVADTLLVASYLANQINEIITCSPLDYAVFKEIKVINPLK